MKTEEYLKQREQISASVLEDYAVRIEMHNTKPAILFGTESSYFIFALSDLERIEKTDLEPGTPCWEFTFPEARIFLEIENTNIIVLPREKDFFKRYARENGFTCAYFNESPYEVLFTDEKTGISIWAGTRYEEWAVKIAYPSAGLPRPSISEVENFAETLMRATKVAKRLNQENIKP
ncbi:MAG: hypothetical protein WC175_04430 [Candidatus Dojkabacteria bacterium]|jgi:hypothetical protein